MFETLREKKPHFQSEIDPRVNSFLTWTLPEATHRLSAIMYVVLIQPLELLALLYL